MASNGTNGTNGANGTNGHSNGNGNGHPNGNGNGNGKRGRKPRLTPELTESILADLRGGLTRKASAIRAGVHDTTMIHWMSDKPSFAAEVRKAELAAYSETHAKMIETALKAGNSRRAACAFANIGPSTFETWLESQPDFATRVEAAEAYAEVGHVANVFKAANVGSWQASAWWLERRRHREWGRRDRLDLEVKLIAEQIAQRTGADPEWLLKRAEEIAAQTLGSVTEQRGARDA